jgi:hypothetical protein
LIQFGLRCPPDRRLAESSVQQRLAIIDAQTAKGAHVSQCGREHRAIPAPDFRVLYDARIWPECLTLQIVSLNFE